MQSAPLDDRWPIGETGTPLRRADCLKRRREAHLDAGRGFGQLPLHRHAPFSHTGHVLGDAVLRYRNEA
jgi:hypothetical protein